MANVGKRGIVRLYGRDSLPHRTRWLLVALGLLFAALPAGAQSLKDYKGNESYDYSNIHSGNKVRTIFYNYGLVGNVGEISGEWPLGTGDEYVGDVTPLVGVEFVHPNGDTIHSVITCLSPRQSPEYGPDGKFWGFEPLPGFAAEPPPDQPGLVAMSNMPDTWPAFWPDKMLTDPRDHLWVRDPVNPGWRNSWNGYFGRDVISADQESYFEMDDNQDREFRTLRKPDGTWVTYYPVASDTGRGGLGIRVAVRGFQWSHFLAEDCIFWHYEITNISDYDYDKVAFGMVVGTLAGGRGDSEDDLAFFDPENDITYSWDSDNNSGTAGWVPVNPQQGIIVGYAGYAFLESPGNPYDGIDNDQDSQDPASPVLTESILNGMVNDGISYQPGDSLVLIDYSKFGDSTFFQDPMRARTVVAMPASGKLPYTIHGVVDTVFADTLYKENGHNNIDDNFNGLIDERIGQPVGGKRLDHVGHKYKNFLTREGVDDLMIDEARDDGIDNDGDWDPTTDDVGFDGMPGTGDAGEGDGVPTYGEPHFDKTDIDESDQIGLTSFDYFSPPGNLRMNDDPGIWNRMRPGVIDVVPGTPEDGDFVYGSGYFPLPSGKTERFSMALLFGEDLEDITNNKITVQKIYDNNYTFVKPPDKPHVRAVPGDGKVTLYWDDISEFSHDLSMPVGHQYDFEGYKIYRATDPGFLEDFVITDGKGRRVFHKPIAQFDEKDGISGYFPQAAFGVSYYLGDDTGLQHVFVDTTVENGQTYFYALTAYDTGLDSAGMVFFPAETPKVITIDREGKYTFDVNTVRVTPGTHAAGYQPAEVGIANHVTGGASGIIYTDVVDEREIQEGRSYRIAFGTENQNNVSDTAFVYADTSASDSLSHTPLLSMVIENPGSERRILDQFDAYFQDLFDDPYYHTWSYFQTVESPVFNGQRLYLLIPRFPGRPIQQWSGWSSATENPDSLLNYNFDIVNYPQARYIGTRWFTDYQVTFYDDYVDSSIGVYRMGGLLNLPAKRVNFRVKDLVSGEYLPVAIDENAPSANPDGKIDAHNEAILIYEMQTDSAGTDTIPTWAITFKYNLENGTVLSPTSGDSLRISMYKPFTSFDQFVYTTRAAKVNRNRVDMNKIKVYPNPYLSASTQEPKSDYTSGRGERRINFIHLPDKCTIRIYNIRGELVQTIEHNSTIFDGEAQWDLRSKDGFDVAYGIYIYHVNSTYGHYIGKFAVIK